MAATSPASGSTTERVVSRALVAFAVVVALIAIGGFVFMLWLNFALGRHHDVDDGIIDSAAVMTSSVAVA